MTVEDAAGAAPTRPAAPSNRLRTSTEIGAPPSIRDISFLLSGPPVRHFHESSGNPTRHQTRVQGSWFPVSARPSAPGTYLPRLVRDTGSDSGPHGHPLSRSLAGAPVPPSDDLTFRPRSTPSAQLSQCSPVRPL